MTAKKRCLIVILPAVVSLMIMAVSPVFSQQCRQVPGTRYNIDNINRWLQEAQGFLGGCSRSSYDACRQADKRLQEADVAIIQILTECTMGNCLRGRLDDLTAVSQRLARLSGQLVSQSGMRRTYDNTLVTVNSWRSTRMCPVARCQQYANAAVSHNKENLARKCGFTGTRWTSDYKGHYDWCFTAPQNLADSETRARADALRQCRTNQANRGPLCQQYARTAVSQNQQNLNKKCGYAGARWTGDYQGHYKWCLGNQQSVADSETRARADALRQCQANQANRGPLCQKYASTAVSQNQQNLAKKCGYKGARWTGDYQGHYKWCLGNQQSVADSETKVRADELNRCQSKPKSCPGPGMTVVHKFVNPPPYTGALVICRDGTGKLWLQGANAAPIASLTRGKLNRQTGCYDGSKIGVPGRTIDGRLCPP
ncbi:MAG: hypothetical protein PHC90_08545 [Syntrophorhabdaceae bacterium]|nr:hypothetical protein [Syntrophorhabdaceae bacterium]